MTDKELIIELMKDGISGRDVADKFEIGEARVYEIWNNYKARYLKLFDSTITPSSMRSAVSIKDIHKPIGVTNHGLVIHVIMDLDHYLELTK